MGRAEGISEQKLAAIADHQRSALFTAAEKAALRYADEMSQTSVNVPAPVFEELSRHFSPPQIVELTAMIALENLRARFNRALEVESDNLCQLPPDHPVRKLAASA